MKNIIFFLLSPVLLNAQTFGESQSCNINVNDNGYNNHPYRKPVIDATVRLAISGSLCTGTLLNVKGDDENIGFYILTAHHCIDGKDLSTAKNVMFHYQSPTGDNNDTWESNSGAINEQSNDLDNPSILIDISNGYEYRHTTKLTKVFANVWGDFALLKMETSPPPHFDYTFAGWNPSLFYEGFSTGYGGSSQPSRYVGIHHPKGDIKKVSGANSAFEVIKLTGSACYTATTTIDILFGWIWGHKVSTQVICNYVENPWYWVPAFTYGTTEHGSSGSGLFNSGNRVVGQLSGGFTGCATPALEFYGKFKNNYFAQSAKNALNPPNDLWTDLAGIGHRKITCWSNLDLEGEYFPKGHYQQTNGYVMTAVNYINTTGRLHVHKDADYRLVAGKAITLNPEFDTDNEGCVFEAKIGGCPSSKAENIDPVKEAMLQRLHNVVIPESNKKTNEDNQNEGLFKIYPNPASNNIQLQYMSKSDGPIEIYIYNQYGQNVWTQKVGAKTNDIIDSKIDVSNLPSSLYILNIRETNSSLVSKKIVVQH